MFRTFGWIAASTLLLACGHKSHSAAPATDQCGDVKVLDRGIVNGVSEPEVVDLTDGQISSIGALNLDMFGSCTATLVAPDVVLTAAHCVEFLEGAPRFLVGEDYLPPDATFSGVEWHMHPLYEGSSGGEVNPAYDLAVVIISGDTVSHGLEPIPVNYDATSLLDETVQAVGYGLTDPEGGWNTTRYWTTQEVLSESPAVYVTSDHGASGLCQGDSGGPMLHETTDGTVKVMGVASAVDSPTCLGNAYYARTDAGAEWLRGFIVTSPCGTETFEGRCQGEMAVWCEDGETYYHECSDFDWECGRNGEGLFRCLSPCGDETFEGRCHGDVAVWCEDEETFWHNCPDFGYVCARNDAGNMRCVEPTECGTVTYRGYCEDGTAVWCEDGETWYHHCDTFGWTCGEDADGNQRCISECETLGFLGVCDGDTARWCVGPRIFERDCALCDTTCGWTGDELGYYCL
ncbi:MAG: trypsin-like serine protease [Deltaproteobacteria bacterium]|nr:trypsin-like serine protease [Deltaproteobacteria bacterium]